MQMKKLFFCTLALCAVSYGTYAQESARTDGDSRRLDSLVQAALPYPPPLTSECDSKHALQAFDKGS